jgi:cyclophilin family peptidyl-prolyl cis-trans isomerase
LRKLRGNPEHWISWNHNREPNSHLSDQLLALASERLDPVASVNYFFAFKFTATICANTEYTMALGRVFPHGRLAGSWLVFAGLLLGGLGCGKSPAPTPSKFEAPPEEHGPALGNPSSTADTHDARAINFDQSFAEATITDVLDGQRLPPDVTMAGKKAGPLRAAIEESWSKIKLTDSSGKPIDYVLRLETSEGSIDIQLRPDIAPNHVRNLLALAQAGYYNGLVFERVVHAEAESGGTTNRLDMVFGGCPIGTGDDGCGHIGYFLRGEFQPNIRHEAGTVGIWHEDHPDSAGCRFYITLGPAPILDGKFTVVGCVVSGLDVVRTIAAVPVIDANSSPENEKPVRPIAIKKATVTPQVMEKRSPVAHNKSGGD